MGEVKIVRGYKWGKEAIRIEGVLKKLGYQQHSINLIINKCKKYGQGKDIKACIQALAMISWAESRGFKHCLYNNCLGIMYRGRLKHYPNISANVDDWVRRYYKAWYTWKRKGGVRFFYVPYGLSYSRYCFNEVAGKIGCPNGYRNASYIYNLTN